MRGSPWLQPWGDVTRTFTITTRKKDQVVDITDTVEDYLQQEKNEQGLCSLFVAHTTCALTTADLDPGTDLDLLEALRHLLPRLSYQLVLGTWQRIVLVELDGPRQRTMHMSTF